MNSTYDDAMNMILEVICEIVRDNKLQQTYKRDEKASRPNLISRPTFHIPFLDMGSSRDKDRKRSFQETGHLECKEAHYHKRQLEAQEHVRNNAQAYPGEGVSAVPNNFSNARVMVGKQIEPTLKQKCLNCDNTGSLCGNLLKKACRIEPCEAVQEDAQK